jgi:hypothetical protein
VDEPVGIPSSCESLSETVAPTRVSRPPAELAFGFGVGGAANPRHQRDAVLADGKPGQQGGHAPRRPGPEGVSERWQPLRDRCGIVIDDVVDSVRGSDSWLAPCPRAALAPSVNGFLLANGFL